MRKIMRRILSYLCAVCMLFSSVGDLGSYIYAAKTLPVILTKTLAASDGETYEIAASFEVRVPEDWDEERDGDYLDSLNVELAVRELNAPEEPEPEEEPGSPEEADPAEEAVPVDDTPPADEAEPVEEPEAAEEEEPEEEPEYEYSYEEYVEKAAAALECESGDLACVRVFDISLRNRITGEELQPESSVKVSIRLLSHDAERGESLNVVHFGDEPEVLESSMNEEAVEFETESFSVFVVLGTVLEKELTASDGKEYRITVSYDRASGIPADAVLCVTEIKEGDEGYGAYVAAAAEALGRSAEELILARPFDITLMDPSTGEAFQPNRNVAVSIQLLQDELGRYSDVNVLHFPGEEGDGPEVMASALEGEAVTFRTDGFSVFVLTGSNDEVIVPQCTFTFYVWSTDVNGYTEYFFSDDQNRPLTKQTVKNGSELIIPQMTSTDTEVFAGWYEGNTDGAGGIIFAESSYDFEHITITENSAVDLYAVYKTYGNVIFHDQYDAASGSFPVAFTRRTELTTMGDTVVPAPIRIDDLAATYNGSGTSMAFFGWSETPVTTPGAANDDHGDPVTVITADADGCITISGDKHLYPVFKEIHWLTFYAAATGQGAAYNGPRYLFAGDTLGSLPVTSRNGYDFTGWFTGTLTVEDEVETVNYGQRVSDENGNLLDGVDDAGVYVTNGGLYLRSDTRLFAGWASKNTADYRVIYWKQAGSAYLFDGSEQFTADVGAAVSAPDGAEGRYSDYHMKEAPAPVTVSADGSTVLHVYYDRNEDVPTVSGTYTLHFADSITEEGKTSADLPQTKELANGASLAGSVIETPASGIKGYAFSKWYLDPYCTVVANFDTLTMPDQDLTVYAGWELEWYVVRIDPNYGELRPLNDQGVPTGTGSTWFWQTIEREPVAEYTYVERSYVESSSGTWYYVNHQGDGLGGSEWPDRYTYYTQDPSKATEDTTFEYAPGEYTYAGWYEVHEDGTETPYLFGERTDHNTLLKLHWKGPAYFTLPLRRERGPLTTEARRSICFRTGMRTMPISFSQSLPTLRRATALSAGGCAVPTTAPSICPERALPFWRMMPSV